MTTINPNPPTRKNSKQTATSHQKSSDTAATNKPLRAENQSVHDSQPNETPPAFNDQVNSSQQSPDEYWESNPDNTSSETQGSPPKELKAGTRETTDTQGKSIKINTETNKSPPPPTETKPSGSSSGSKKPPSGGSGKGSNGGGGSMGGQMSFLEHLDELRQRLVFAVLSIIVVFFACFYFHEHIYDFLAVPVTKALRSFNPEYDRLVYTNPMEPFNIYLKVSFVAAIFASSPLILWQLWLFISPGLYRHEKRYVLPFVTLTSALFMSGGYFAYRVVLPPVFQFLFEFGGDFQPFIHINEYFSLASTLLVGMGLVFELPVIILILSIFGIVTPRFLLKNIRYAILIIAILAAALAPTPDWVTLMLFSLPMLGLYFLSIGLCFLVQLRRKKKSSQEELK